MKTFTIKDAREISGLSQKNASQFLKVPFRTYQDWEYGKRTCNQKEKIIELLLGYKNISQDIMDMYKNDFISHDEILELNKFETVKTLMNDIPVKESLVNSVYSDLPDSIIKSLSAFDIVNLMITINENMDYWKFTRDYK